MPAPAPTSPVASRPVIGPTTAAPGLGPLGPGPQTPSFTASQTVTVVRGDSLWAIAARHLGPHATPLQVAREWPRWYAANHTVIGPNPNLIRVGQILTVPTSGAPS
jgi:nucleoid-associated protein YgaU